MVFWDTFLSILLFYVFARPLDSAVISKQHFSSRSSLNTLFLCPRLRHMAAMLVLTHSLSLFFSVSLSLSFSLFATILCKDFSIKCLHHILLLITKHLQKSFSLAYCAPFCKLVLDSTAGTVNISIALLKTIVCNIFLAKTFVHIFSPNFQSLETPSDAIPPFVHPISLN